MMLEAVKDRTSCAQSLGRCQVGDLIATAWQPMRMVVFIVIVIIVIIVIYKSIYKAYPRLS